MMCLRDRPRSSDLFGESKHIESRKSVYTTPAGHSLGAPVDLGGDHIACTLPTSALQDFSDFRLGVRLGDVEQVDAAIDGQLEYGFGLVIADAGREDGPRSQADVRDAQSTLAQILVPQSRRRRRTVPQRQCRIRPKTD